MRAFPGRVIQLLFAASLVVSAATGQKPDKLRQAGDLLRQLNPDGLPEVEPLVKDGIAEYLTKNPAASAFAVEEQLAQTTANPDAVPPLASVIRVPSPKRPIFIAASAFGSCAGCSRTTWMGVFQFDGKRYRETAAVENPLPGKSVHLSMLASDGGSIFFALSGNTLGDSLNHLSVVAYVFDGHTLRAVWSRRELPRGTVEVVKNTLVLRYSNLRGFESTHFQDIYAIIPPHLLPLGHSESSM